MKKTIAAIVATIVGVISAILFLNKKSNISTNPKINELEKEAEKLKEGIEKLEKVYGKPVEDKSLESELDYWKKK